jgi:hypothetical protein
MASMLIRGLNWAPDSKDSEDSDEVQFVMDSMAGDTKVPKTQESTGVIMEEGIDEVEDVALTLLQLESTEVSKFDADKELKKVVDLMLLSYFLNFMESAMSK